MPGILFGDGLFLLTGLFKFAIRPNIRNNKDLTRDQVIKTVAAAVGPGHSVDLKDYDLLILVDVYKASFLGRGLGLRREASALTTCTGPLRDERRGQGL